MRTFLETASPIEESIWDHCHPVFAGALEREAQGDPNPEWTEWYRDPERDEPSDWNNEIVASVAGEWFLAATRSASRVVDVGGGNGFPSLYLARAGVAVTSIDRSSKQIQNANRLKKRMGLDQLELIEGGVEADILQDNSFGAATLARSLRLVEDPLTALTCLKKALSPGSTVAILEDDWAELLHGRRFVETAGVLLEAGDVFLIYRIQTGSPYRDRHYRCRLSLESPIGQELLERLGDHEGAVVSTSVLDIAPQLIVREIEAASYQEARGFDPNTLAVLLKDAGFTGFRYWRLPNTHLFAEELRENRLLMQMPEDVRGVLRAMVMAMEPTSYPTSTLVTCQRPYELDLS